VRDQKSVFARPESSNHFTFNPVQTAGEGKAGKMKGHRDPRTVPLDESKHLSRPNFIVIGAMKAGTTSLYHYLRSHPQVFMAPIKELDFFVEDGNWKRGFAWYTKQFEEAGPHAIAVGEASTAYSKHPSVPGVPERIAAHIPHARLIYILRDPIERIRSHYQHRVSVGAEREPLHRAVTHNAMYLDCSRYAAQVDEYLRYFNRDQLLLITSERLRHDRAETVSRVYEFLGVTPDHIPKDLDREFYKSRDRPTFAPVAWRLRHVLKRHFPATKRAKEVVDTALPRLFGRSAAEGPAQQDFAEPIISDTLRSELIQDLRDDLLRLSRYMDEGFDCWGLT
jgi:hypothetical protein